MYFYEIILTSFKVGFKIVIAIVTKKYKKLMHFASFYLNRVYIWIIITSRHLLRFRSWLKIKYPLCPDLMAIVNSLKLKNPLFFNISINSSIIISKHKMLKKCLWHATSLSLIFFLLFYFCSKYLLVHIIKYYFQTSCKE